VQVKPRLERRRSGQMLDVREQKEAP